MKAYSLFLATIILVVVSACDKDKPTTTTTTRPATSTLTEALTNPKCTKPIMSTGTLGGFLWKPESERGGLAVLLPGNFELKFNNCFVEKKSGGVEQLTWTGFTNPDGDHNNKLRQTWRGSQKGSAYKSTFVTCVSYLQECRWIIKDSSQRQD